MGWSCPCQQWWWAGCWWAPPFWSRSVPVSSGGLPCAGAVGFSGEPFPAQLDRSRWPHILHMTKRWCNSGHSSSCALGSFPKMQACVTDVLQHVSLIAPVPAPLALGQGQALAGGTPSRSLPEFLIYLLCVLWKIRLQHSGTTVQLCKSSFSPSERTKWKSPGMSVCLLAVPGKCLKRCSVLNNLAWDQLLRSNKYYVWWCSLN